MYISAQDLMASTPGEGSPKVSMRRCSALANLSGIPRETLVGKLLRAPLRLIATTAIRRCFLQSRAQLPKGGVR